MNATRQTFAVAAAWLLGLLSFIGLAIRAATGGVLAIDLSIAEAIQDLPDMAGRLFGVENWLGNTVPLTLIGLLLAFALLLRGSRESSLLVMLALLASAADLLIKRTVREPRPSLNFIGAHYPADNLSFPSGHVIGVTLVFCAVFVFAPRLFGSRAAVIPVRSLSVLLIATIGLARVWVGAHWPSDVLGGYLYALLFLIPALAWLRTRVLVLAEPKRAG